MLKDMIHTGIGMGVLLKEKVENEVKKLEDEGKIKTDDAKTFLDSLSTKGKDEEQRIKTLLKDTMKEVIDELGIATKEDIEKLKKELSKN